MNDVGARRWWALGALNLVVLAVALPVTVVSVALPTLAGALHASASDLQWFVSAYALAMAAALLPGGLLGDRYGRKKVLLGALVAYAGGSVAAAAATSPGAFIAAQAVLGLARDSVFAGVEIARQLGSTPLLESARAAFVHGLDVMLWVSAGTAVAGIALALIFLPRRHATVGDAEPSEHAEPHHEPSA